MKIQFKYKKSFANFSLDCALTLSGSDVTILFGPSGCGKSTLLNCIAGLEKSDFAYAKLGDEIFDDSKNKIHLPAHQRKIGYVFQDSRLFPHMTVIENLRYGYSRSRDTSPGFNINEVTSKFRLNDLLLQRPHQLSGGQKQRVALARAILSKPQLLILDEPLSALDYASKQQLIPYLQFIYKEFSIPVIYVSHDLKEVLQLGDNIVLMDDGRIIEQGNLAELCTTQPLLTQDEGPAFILQGEVIKVDEHESITSVNCRGFELQLSGNVLPVKQTVRILVHATDVSLTLQKSTNSSILNILPIVISKVHNAKNGKQIIECVLGETTILSVISLRSQQNLNIVPGLQCYAQFKATAMVR